jgi:hypothetical protein
MDNVSGQLKVHVRTKKAVILKIRSEIFDSFISIEMKDSKDFFGNDISRVHKKLVSWFSKFGVKF